MGVAYMGLLDLINHFLNFLAPAMVVGLLLAVVAPFFNKKWPSAHAVIAQTAINSIAGVLVLVLGLWVFGRDAKMASYGAMLVSVASVQWWFLRGAR
jgi:type III secretory pathway component EscT